MHLLVRKAAPVVLTAVGLLATLPFGQAVAAGDETKTVGRVRVTMLRDAGVADSELVSGALRERFSTPVGKRFAERRIISVRPRFDDAQRFDATLYDYTVEKAFDLVLDAKGNELSRNPLAGQPARSQAERDDAWTVVRENPAFAEAISSGAITIYEPMPPVTTDADGRRLINVGVYSRVDAGGSLEKNEIVSVHIPTGSIVRYPTGAPDTARAAPLACGAVALDCAYNTGPCAFYQVVWPAADPVWKFKVRHPSCTSGVQADGTGLELTDVYYRDRLILKRAEVPVLNVLYEGTACGPYRDPLTIESCFQATGTDVPSSGSGIRVATAGPSTLCDGGGTGTDAGNFRGVALFDEGDALRLMTETEAGWYRYAIEWRLHVDGTMEPVFGFGATLDSCTCSTHVHHAYWRFEWAIDAVSNGTTDDPATGITTLERRRAGTLDQYDPIATEGTFLRPAINPEADYWRIKSPATSAGYLLEPGPHDGTAIGDEYGKWDIAGLALNANQINDLNTDTSININPWLSGETIGTNKRLVTWYHLGYSHHTSGGGSEFCELAGPKLVPFEPCAAAVSLDRSVYGCAQPMAIAVTDSDLAGAGTVSVAITSGTEPPPETLVLNESPAGSGRFQGAITTMQGPPVNGDGKISVADGESVVVQFIDALSCGAPNVPVARTAPIDCTPPSIAHVQAVAGISAATITWDTSESGSGAVHYGTSLPTAGLVAAGGTATVHTGLLTGLTDCTTYYYWVESVDAAGNTTESNDGGGYFAFTTPRLRVASYPSSGPPIPIPDSNSAGAGSTVAVADAEPVRDVNVTVNVTHTYDADLTLSLITPQNATIPLALGRGGSANNYTNTVFDDEAATPIASGTAPFTGSFRPDSPLSAADGPLAAGDWTFKVLDLSPADTGTIVSWTLGLSSESTCVPAGSPPPIPDGSFGAGMTASRLGGDGVHVTWDVATCTATNDHILYGALQDVATYAPTGAVCGVGPLGSYDWADAPAGDLWFVVVGDDGAAKEGSWGTDGTGAERNGATPSGLCGFTTRNNTGTCP